MGKGSEVLARNIKAGIIPENAADGSFNEPLIELFQQPIGTFRELFTLQNHLESRSADLAPKGGGSDTGKQQGSNLIGNPGLLQIAEVPHDLDPEFKGADGVSVEAAQAGQHILVGDVEMFSLAFALLKAFADDFEHVFTPHHFLLQVQHAQHIAECVGVVAILVVVEQVTHDLQAQLKIGCTAIKDIQRRLRTLNEKALQRSFLGFRGDIAGFGQLLNKSRCLKNACHCQGNVIPILAQSLNPLEFR